MFIFSAFFFLSCGAHFGVYHKVKKNETLYSIAQLYGTTVDNLEKNNNIPDVNRISVGDYVFVPGVAAPLDTNGKASAAPSNTKKVEDKTVKTQPEKKSSPGKAKSTPPAKSKPVKPSKPAKPGKLIWPVKGVITSKFGMRWGKLHRGIDIGCPEKTPVVAAADGKVVLSGEKPGYGLVILIEHSDKIFTVYAHNSKNLVKEGVKVKKGEKIALVGQTGRATGPHLHFEIIVQAKPDDPLKYLPKTVP